MQYGKMYDNTDYGPEPLIINIDKAAKANANYRQALWTGEHLQVTLMSILPGEDVGIEVHENLDQFIRIEDGCAIVKLGRNKNKLNYQKCADSNTAIIIPAGTWHNIYNYGNKPLKLYSIYSPPEHPYGTIHRTRADDIK